MRSRSSIGDTGDAGGAGTAPSKRQVSPAQVPGDSEISALMHAPRMSGWATVDDDDSAFALGMAIIGTGIRSGRLRLSMTQRQLAWRVGVSQSAISRLETGTIQGLRLRTLARIVAVLEASPGYVFPDGPPAPSRRLPGQRAA